MPEKIMGKKYWSVKSSPMLEIKFYFALFVENNTLFLLTLHFLHSPPPPLDFSLFWTNTEQIPMVFGLGWNLRWKWTLTNIHFEWKYWWKKQFFGISSFRKKHFETPLRSQSHHKTWIYSSANFFSGTPKFVFVFCNFKWKSRMWKKVFFSLKSDLVGETHLLFRSSLWWCHHLSSTELFFCVESKEITIDALQTLYASHVYVLISTWLGPWSWWMVVGAPL